jgi:hypothetical protein
LPKAPALWQKNFEQSLDQSDPGLQRQWKRSEKIMQKSTQRAQKVMEKFLFLSAYACQNAQRYSFPPSIRSAFHRLKIRNAKNSDLMIIVKLSLVIFL